MQKFWEILSPISNIITIGLFLYNLKNIKPKSIQKNVFFQVLIASLILTAVVYFVPWGEFHYGEQKLKVVYVSVPAKIKTTVPKNTTTSNQSDNKDIVNLPSLKRHKTLHIIGKSNHDTIIKVKNLVTGTNYGNQQVGDNNTMITSENFQSISPKLKIDVNRNLQLLTNNFNNHPFINIEIEYDTKRIKVAEELSDIIAPYNLGLYDPSNETQNGFTEPVRFTANIENKRFIEEFIKAINPYFSANFSYDFTNDYPLNKIVLKIGGEPSYDLNGRVTIK